MFYDILRDFFKNHAADRISKTYVINNSIDGWAKLDPEAGQEQTWCRK